MNIHTVKKKPIEVSAVQWDGTAEGAVPIIQWIHENDGSVTYACEDDAVCSGNSEGHVIKIRTLEGDMDANEKWWIIRGVKGEFYPCDPEVFDLSYDIIN